MDPTLLEAAKNDDDSDLDVKFSGDVLDELLLAKANLPNDIIQINIMEIPIEKHEVNSSPTTKKEVLALELDIHPPNNTEVDDNDDDDDDGDAADCPLIPNNTTDQGIDISKVALLILFFTLISGSTISALSNLKDARRTETKLTLGFKDIFLHPDKLPDAFYDILLLTIAFIVNIVLAVVSLWPIIKDHSFFYRTLLFVGVAAFFISFDYILKDKVPKLWLTMQNPSAFQASSWCGCVAFLLPSWLSQYQVQHIFFFLHFATWVKFTSALILSIKSHFVR